MVISLKNKNKTRNFSVLLIVIILSFSIMINSVKVIGQSDQQLGLKVETIQIMTGGSPNEYSCKS
jgi:hypothetical protein